MKRCLTIDQDMRNEINRDEMKYIQLHCVNGNFLSKVSKETERGGVMSVRQLV